MVLTILIGDYYFYDSDLQLIYYLKKKTSFDWSKEMSYASGHWENPLSDEIGR